MTKEQKTCQNCKWECRGRSCPIFKRLHEQNWNLKIWSLNRTNFGCILFEPKNSKAEGSVLDKLDHTKRSILCNKDKK